MNDKQIQNGDRWDVFAKSPVTGKTVQQSSPRSTENEAEIIADAKQNLEAVRNDEMPKENPDGTPGHEWIQTYDEEGNEVVKPKKKES